MNAKVERTLGAVVRSGRSSAVKSLGTAGVRGEAPHSCRPPSIWARLLLFLIGLWRWTAPMRMPRCRFEPSCSAYAQESIERYGAGRGAWRALRRVVRCNPWNPGGVDPVD
ncbi:MAG: membrane protein insertion efficiency factor YidD [Nitriliruptorales bacterium]